MHGCAGAIAALKPRDVGTFQSTIQNITGEVANLDIALNGVVAQFESVASSIKSGYDALKEQSVLSKDDSFAFLITYNKLRLKVNSTIDHPFEKKSSIEASPTCQSVKQMAARSGFNTMKLAQAVANKTDPAFATLFAAVSDGTRTKFDSDLAGFACQHS
ncbi:hypothetical protein NLG97_g874 [Lecanicillium saksenae]|uniref:Uncharacterized protein n=1 Tax=Lecanicillium saksenae TaxID=468837 RepID=A0ACC1R808_9HYPO|nr:hypothetical protein NLG97_g874 [Lecanicillium saksenae]